MIDISEALARVRYVVDAGGEKTDVVLPVATWTELLATWKLLIEELEDQQDAAVVQEWLEQRASGTIRTVSLDELERESRLMSYHVEATDRAHAEIGALPGNMRQRVLRLLRELEQESHPHTS